MNIETHDRRKLAGYEAWKYNPGLPPSPVPPLNNSSCHQVSRIFTSVLLSLLCLLLTVQGGAGQSPYRLETGKEFLLGGSGAALLGTSMLIDRRVGPLTGDQIAGLRPEDVWAPDRWVTRQWSLPAQHTSDVFLFGSFVLPVTMLLDQPSRSNFGQVSLFALESLLLSAGLTNLTKTLVKRPRPYLYNPDVPMAYKLKKDARYSFFSGHTSLTATMSFLSAKLYNDFYPDSNARPYVWATAAVIPAVTGYLRIRGGKHYLTDVLVGYAIGAAVGVLVPELHK